MEKCWWVFKMKKSAYYIIRPRYQIASMCNTVIQARIRWIEWCYKVFSLQAGREFQKTITQSLLDNMNVSFLNTFRRQSYVIMTSKTLQRGVLSHWHGTFLPSSCMDPKQSCTYHILQVKLTALWKKFRQRWWILWKFHSNNIRNCSVKNIQCSYSTELNDIVFNDSGRPLFIKTVYLCEVVRYPNVETIEWIYKESCIWAIISMSIHVGHTIWTCDQQHASWCTLFRAPVHAIRYIGLPHISRDLYQTLIYSDSTFE